MIMTKMQQTYFEKFSSVNSTFMISNSMIKSNDKRNFNHLISISNIVSSGLN